MFAFLLWCILFVLCWPLALMALIAYPFIWLLLLPFRIIGVAVHGVLEVIFLAITLPFRLRAKYPIRARTFQSRVYEYYDPEVNSSARPIQLEVRKK